jgi:hypothetical protein
MSTGGAGLTVVIADHVPTPSAGQLSSAGVVLTLQAFALSA